MRDEAITERKRVTNPHDDNVAPPLGRPLRATLDSRLGALAPLAFSVGRMATELLQERRAAGAGVDTPEIAFVACVESGPLEAQTVRLAESIREFGGALAGSEILAITPRFGPPLARRTRRRFHDLGVRHERLASHPRYAWYHYLNTPIALAAAEDLTDADLLCWTDSDLLFMGEPTELLLPPDVDFTAGSTDNGVVGTTGPDSPHERDWARLCTLLGIDLDELPWVTTHLEKERIRLYFQAGLFSYRRGLGFSEYYLDMCTHALDQHFGFADSGENYIDQVCLGLAVHRMGLRWRQLDPTHNFPMASFLPHADLPQELVRARVLHYHDSMQPHFWPTCLERLSTSHPQIHAWLSDRSPLTDPAPALSRLLTTGLRVSRGVPRRRYRQGARAA
jgi:hypothetical protein